MCFNCTKGLSGTKLADKFNFLVLLVIDLLRKTTYVLLLLMFFLPLMTVKAVSQSLQGLTERVWKAQTIDSLSDGVWVIPEEAINQYFAFQADDSKVKNPVLRLLGENKAYIAFDSSLGRVGLTCEIKQFVHNQAESYAEVYVQKKEISGKPIVNWMLKFVSIGAVADLYGNPLKDIKQVETRISGNTLKINFRPLIEESLLSTSLGKKVTIDRITTRDGMLELHTNMRAADMLGTLMGD